MSRKIQFVTALALLSMLAASVSSAASPASATPAAAPKAKAPAATAKSTSHKASHHRRASGGYRYKTMFVPPPPAVMPSILPEVTARQMNGTDSVADESEPKPENPYKKYIHTPEGNAPAPIQTRKGVVIWANRG